uniref:Uncharacterized protein n=1 Tax=Parascaris univalens TaxID=6257 RepID=A0A914ZGL1_PARUN
MIGFNLEDTPKYAGRDGLCCGVHTFDFDFVPFLDQEAVQEVEVGLALGAGVLLENRTKKSAGSRSGERIFELQWVSMPGRKS